MTTFRRTAFLASLVSACLLVPGRTTAQQTNALSSLKSSYEQARLEIGAACVRREKECVKQYGKAVEALLDAMRKKGDLDGYRVVEAEKKRFSAEGTVPDAEDAAPVLPTAVQAYHKAVADVNSGKERETAGLLCKYAAALDGLIKQLTRENKIEDALAAKAEREKVQEELANLQANLPTKTGIPSEAKVFKGHHYLPVTGKLTWHEAKKACAKRGGHLVTVANQEENDFLASLVSEITIPPGGSFWLGCTDEAREGDWRWVDGSKVKYGAWYPGEPNNGGGGGGTENFAGTRFLKGVSDWNDIPADNGDNAGYICEWDY